MPKITQKINFPSGLRWTFVSKPDKKEVLALANDFNFVEQDLLDCLPPCQRPKLIDRENYIFMILQFPVYCRESGTVESSEVDFFIGPDYLVTVFDEELFYMKEFCAKYIKNSKLQAVYQEKNPTVLLYEILNYLLHACFPMLSHISQDIDAVDKNIFNFNHNRIDIIKEIMRIKRNIVNFRKTMQAHKSIIQKLIIKGERMFATNRLELYYNNLINHTKDIWDFLSNYKDTTDALYETHESLVSHRLNQIIKTLTVFSVIVFPMTLLATIFAMRVDGGMPFANHPHGFWFIIVFMFLGSLAMVAFFKKKKIL